MRNILEIATPAVAIAETHGIALAPGLQPVAAIVQLRDELERRAKTYRADLRRLTGIIDELGGDPRAAIDEPTTSNGDAS